MASRDRNAFASGSKPMSSCGFMAQLRIEAFAVGRRPDLRVGALHGVRWISAEILRGGISL